MNSDTNYPAQFEITGAQVPNIASRINKDAHQIWNPGWRAQSKFRQTNEKENGAGYQCIIIVLESRQKKKEEGKMQCDYCPESWIILGLGNIQSTVS